MINLMEGKRGLVIGVANERSIAWGIASVLAKHGAELAITYQTASFEKRVRPLAESIGSKLILPADVQDEQSLKIVFDKLQKNWRKLDFLVHAIAYSDKEELVGSFINTSRSNFSNSLDISCYSLIDLSRRAVPLMKDGGSIVTLTYMGSQRVTPNYNVMGVAKAALESTVRYLANDLGEKGITVNAISPGPMKTLAGAAIGGARTVYRTAEENSPLKENPSQESVGGTALYLLSNYGKHTTGEVIFVDGGYHTIGMPQLTSS
ncbi:MAG: NADH-specific enoyl-ACP reductase [Rhodobacteraceae bacterium]|nr:MAG: NADH-specific enoyl-ACP reductase [Paracoccaceae bacterium]|tara:strand:- start:55 stop:843 length:789 start_codon:yes stop_codon:yes gene_type:complete